VKILGIDPGTAITGWGVIKQSAKSVNDLSVVDYGVIRTKKTKQHLNRLQEIYEDMKQVLNRFLPDIVAVEKLYFCKNVKTAITVGEARGMVLLAIAQMGLEFYEYTPLQIKDAVCGYGKADKKQVQNMVSSILSLDSVPKPDDAADALAVAICCSSAYKMQQNLKSNVVDK
jgi:crossover junction endodeoxyribonuclease RuvC